MSVKPITAVTTEQAARAVSLILQLAEAATKDGLAAELRLERPSIKVIVDLAAEIQLSGNPGQLPLTIWRNDHG